MNRRRQNKSHNLIGSALHGAVVAIIVALAGSYLTSGWAAIVAAPADGSAAVDSIRLALVNIYAIQHVPLMAAGTAAGAKTTAVVTLPLTIWVAIPFIALVIGGYVAVRRREPRSRWDTAVCVVVAAGFYAVILGLLTRFAFARLLPSAFPSAAGVEFDPPDLPFHANLPWALVSSWVLGIIGMCLGGVRVVAANRRLRPLETNWACIKAVFWVVLVIQVLAGGIGLAAYSRYAPSGSPSTANMVRPLPTLTGIATVLLYGGDLRCGVESDMKGTAAPTRTFYMKTNLYNGMVTADAAGKKPSRLAVRYVIVFGLIVSRLAAIAGSLAVRWGSRGSDAVTAFKITVINTAYIVTLMWACSLGWTSEVTALGIAGSSRVFVTQCYATPMLLMAICVFVFSFFGAWRASRR